MERAFLEQAAQVNVADRELMENGEKVRKTFCILNNHSLPKTRFSLST